ncbi:hypothetical protein L7F22_027431 [Adiantum nelumboides]|nr:hypothetical protein [Adiantum nelumboides]
MQRLQDIGVSEAIRWGIYALYELVTGRVRALGGLSDAIESTIGVKQGCPLSPTLFGIYIDELSEYVDIYGDAGSSLAGVMIPLLMYADDVVLISDSPEGLQRQLDALQRFCADKDLIVNLGKTKVIMFNTTQAWVTRAEHQFTFREEVVEQVHTTAVGPTEGQQQNKKATENLCAAACVLFGAVEHSLQQKATGAKALFTGYGQGTQRLSRFRCRSCRGAGQSIDAGSCRGRGITTGTAAHEHNSRGSDGRAGFR